MCRSVFNVSLLLFAVGAVVVDAGGDCLGRFVFTLFIKGFKGGSHGLLIGDTLLDDVGRAGESFWRRWVLVETHGVVFCVHDFTCSNIDPVGGDLRSITGCRVVLVFLNNTQSD